MIGCIKFRILFLNLFQISIKTGSFHVGNNALDILIIIQETQSHGKQFLTINGSQHSQLTCHRRGVKGETGKLGEFGTLVKVMYFSIVSSEKDGSKLS